MVLATATFGTGYSGNAYIQHTLFLGGPYKGQWFDYLGAEGQAIFTTSGELSAGVGSSVFIAFNDPSKSNTNNPKDFAGKYSGEGIAGQYKPVIGDASISGQYSVSADKAWKIIGLGYSASVGPSGGLFAGASGTFEFHAGTTMLVPGQQMVTTKKASWVSLLHNWMTHVHIL